MTGTLPHNEEAERSLLSVMFSMPVNEWPTDMREITPDMFYNPLHKRIYEAILQVHAEGLSHDVYNVGNIVGGSSIEILKMLVDGSLNLMYNYNLVRTLKECYAKRLLAVTAVKIGRIAYGNDATTEALKCIQEIQNACSVLGSAFVQLNNPIDALKQRSGWYTDTGIPGLDAITRFFSREVTLISGDPNSGKTTMAIDIATHVALSGEHPVYVIMVENTPDEWALALLNHTLVVSAIETARIANSPQPNRETLEKLSELWQTMYNGIPIYARVVRGGLEELKRIAASIPPNSVLIIDHLFAILNQRTDVAQRKEHETMNAIMTFLDGLASEKNAVVIAFNQFTKQGREGKDRGADSTYGGSGPANIAKQVLTLQSEPFQPNSPVKPIECVIHKAKQRVLADENGNPIDPVGKKCSLWLDVHFRTFQNPSPFQQS